MKKNNLMASKLLLACTPLLLTGCLSGADLVSSEGIIEKGWARQVHVAPQKPLYCYKSLASVNCYSTPQPHRSEALVGHYEEVIPPVETSIFSLTPEPEPTPASKPAGNQPHSGQAIAQTPLPPHPGATVGNTPLSQMPITLHRGSKA